MYTGFDFKEKDELVAAVRSGKKVTVFRPRIWKAFISEPPVNGKVSVEGPYRIPWAQGLGGHDWFAKVYVKNGIIAKVE